MDTFVYSFIPLDSDYRGNYFANQYFSVKEEANIEGCVFLNCKFDSQSSLNKATKYGICVDCSVETNLSKPRYVQAKFEAIPPAFHALGLTHDYVTIYSKSENALEPFGLTAQSLEYDDDEDEEDKYSLKSLNGNTFVDFSSNETHIVELGHTHSEMYGSIRIVSFDSYERLYERDDKRIKYDGLIFVPPKSLNSTYWTKGVYLFVDDCYLNELECSLYDIQHAIENINIDEESRRSLLSDIEENEDEYENEINTLGDARSIFLGTHLDNEEFNFKLTPFILSGGELVESFEIFSYHKFYSFIVAFFSKYKKVSYNGLLLDNEVLLLDNSTKPNIVKLD